MFSLPVNKEKTRAILPSLLLIPVLFSLPEIFLYPGALLNNIGVSIQTVFLGIFVVYLLARVFELSVSTKFFAFYTYIFMPIFLGFSIILNLIDTFTRPNFTYSTFHIHPDGLFTVALLFLLFLIPFFHVTFAKRMWRWSVFTAGILGFYLYVFLKWRLSDIFYTLDGEDGILEYLQFFLYLVSSFFALLSLRVVNTLSVAKVLRVTWLTLLTLSVLGLFFVAFEEISWGQRLFDIQTPESLREINRQKETNIHNIDGIFGKVYYGYFVVALYGFLSWTLRYIPLSLFGHTLGNYVRPVLSRWYLMPFFLVMIGYVIWRLNGPETGYHLWEEASEVFFTIGVSLLFFRGYKHMQQYAGKKTTR